MVYINGNRNGYSEEQCGYTMTVAEMVDYLNQFDDDEKIYLRNDNVYTFGSINEIDIYEDSNI